MNVWLYRQSYIEHHGIKGQRWGIRRYQNPDGSLTDLGRKRYGATKDIKKAYRENNKNLTFTAVNMDTYMDKYNSLSKQKIKISEGTKLNRVEIGDINSSDIDRVYALYDKDKLGSYYYDTVWASKLREFANDPNVQVNKNTYRVKADIIAPDKETRINIAQTMFEENKNLYNRVIKSNLDQYARRLTNDYTTEDIQSKINKHSRLKTKVDEFAVELFFNTFKSMKDPDKYDSFMAALPKDDKLFKEYVDRLSAKGYGAIYDDNSRRVAKAPLIIFDKSLLEKTKTKVLLKEGSS